MASSKTTFVFIPGAWHTPFYFEPVVSLLSKPPYSYPCICIPLLSVLRENELSSPLMSIEPDVNVIRKGVEAVLDTGSDVVIVMHSYGGVPAMESMKYFPDGVHKGEGTGKILRMIWVGSFVFDVGGSLIGACGGDLPWWDVNHETNIVHPINPKQIFYNDISPATAAPYLSALRPFSYPCLCAKLTYSPIASIPSTYVICENDQAIPVQAQEGMIEAAKASVGVSGGKGNIVPFDVVERLDAGHSPFISRTEELVSILARGAGGR